jgi:hypothetical protein
VWWIGGDVSGRSGASGGSRPATRYCGKQDGGVLDSLQPVPYVGHGEEVSGPAFPDQLARDQPDPPAQHMHRGLTGIGVLGQRGAGRQGDHRLAQGALVTAEDGAALRPLPDVAARRPCSRATASRLTLFVIGCSRSTGRRPTPTVDRPSSPPRSPARPSEDADRGRPGRWAEGPPRTGPVVACPDPGRRSPAGGAVRPGPDLTHGDSGNALDRGGRRRRQDGPWHPDAGLNPVSDLQCQTCSVRPRSCRAPMPRRPPTGPAARPGSRSTSRGDRPRSGPSRGAL